MKFALVNGSRVEASKAGKGICPICGSELIAKCGEVYVNYWAHKGGHNCDPWWENETSWHRSWKDNFPKDWQEAVQTAENGEKHIADVKTDGGWVLEFQHSYLKPEERRLRTAFYPKLVWVVDGTRRPTDKIQFEKIINAGRIIAAPLQIIQVNFPEECRLLKEWHDSNALVYFDFEENKEAGQAVLWFLYPRITAKEAYLMAFPRHYFIEMHNANKFEEYVSNSIMPIHKELVNRYRRSQIK
jgi:competence protein CoiA